MMKQEVKERERHTLFVLVERVEMTYFVSPSRNFEKHSNNTGRARSTLVLLQCSDMLLCIVLESCFV